MFRRELRDRLVDPRPNLSLFHALVGQRVRLRHGARRRIDVLHLDSVIELRARAFYLLFAQPVNGDVGHDPVHPGIERRLAAEASDRFPGLQETVLGKVPGVLLVMYHVVDHAKNSGAVAADQLVECFGIARLALLDQVEFRDIGLSRSRFRMHGWTGEEAISFNATHRLPKRRSHSPRYFPMRVMIPSRTSKRRCCRTACWAGVISASETNWAPASIDTVMAFKARLR